MEEEIKKVREENYTVSQAAREHGIPHQTLKDHISGKWNSENVGRGTELTKEEELGLVNHIKYMPSVSKPLTIPVVKMFA